MGDNHSNINRELKENIDLLFSIVVKVPYEHMHPLLILQASKSLIGMDLNNPSDEMLKWLENYIRGFGIDFKEKMIESKSLGNDLFSMLEFQEMINRKEINKSKAYLNSLLTVADAKYIMEFIFEYSLRCSSYCALFCWYAYKTILFIPHQYSLPVLHLCLDCIYFEENISKDEMKKYDFYFFCNIFYILKQDMVRSKSISAKLLNIINILKKNMEIVDENLKKIISEIFQQKNFINYIIMISKTKLNVEKIILLDSLRVAIKEVSNEEKESLIETLRNIKC